MATKKKQPPTLVLTLFSLPFAGVGVFMAYMMISSVLAHMSMRNWIETPATIVRAELQTHDNDDSTTQNVLAEYEYRYAGKDYKGDRVAISSSADNIGSFQQNCYDELEEYRASGRPFRCYVNPANPREAILYRQLRTELLLFQAMFMIVFGGAGFGLLAWVTLSTARKKKIDARLAETPDKPWLIRDDWREGRIKSSGSEVLVLAMFALIWNGLSWPIVLLGLVPQFERLPFWVYIFFLFPIIGIGLIGSLIHKILRHRKYGASVLHLEKTPGVIGGPLVGVIKTARPLQTESGCLLKLLCRKAQTDDSETSTVTIWQTEHTVPIELIDTDFAQTTIPVRLAIPYDCRPTSQEEKIAWKLEATAATTGIDYKAQFDVPVFKTEESREDFELSEVRHRTFGGF